MTPLTDPWKIRCHNSWRNRLPLLAAASIALVSGMSAHADVPNLINYQGRLTDKDGAPMNTPVAMEVAVFSQATGGTAAFSQNLGQVQVKQGIYSVAFGGDTLPPVLQNPECWLELTVNGSIMQPRQRLLAVPYAVNSAKVDGHSWADIVAPLTAERIADGAITALKLSNGSVTASKLSIGTPQPGYIIKWDGTQWTAATGDVPVHGHIGPSDGGSLMTQYRSLVSCAQNAFQIVQATTFVNQDFLAADIFSDSDGKNNTVDTGTSTAVYNSGAYYPNSVSNPANILQDPDLFTDTNYAFDNNDATGTYKYTTAKYADWRLGVTFASKYVERVRIKCSHSSYYAAKTLRRATVTLESYNGSTWSTVAQLANASGDTTNQAVASYDSTYLLNQTVQGLRIYFSGDTGTSNSGSNSANLYTLAEEYASSSSVKTNNLLKFDGTENMCGVYVKTSPLINTGITVDLTDGTNTIVGKPINTPIDISSLVAGDLRLTFNLSASSQFGTPFIIGYAIAITK